MGGLVALMYGVVVYGFFLATFLYAVGFVGNVVVPKSIDSGTVGPMAEALLVNTLLLGSFAIQHSVMARQGFKKWWTRIVPKSVERTTYVLLASLVLCALFAHWRPMPDLVWSIESPTAAVAIHALSALGWGLVLLSTFLIDHFELFGIKQVFMRMLGRSLPMHAFKTPMLYRHVRHPLYLGFVIAFWAAPAMSVGHLLFAVGTTGYILIAIWFEERDLVAAFGDEYRRYRQRVGMLLPRLGARPASTQHSPSE